jgi:hypothetical protein
MESNSSAEKLNGDSLKEATLEQQVPPQTESAPQLDESSIEKTQEEIREQPWNNETDTEEKVENEIMATKGDATLSQSMSNEFTYTTFGKPPDSDEHQNDDNSSLASPSGVNFDKLIVSESALAEKSTLQSKNDKLDSDIEPHLPSGPSESKMDNSQSESESDSIKKMPFDTIIENVKLNKIANKEVCDYILNLLVNGEFDLEKKFVIQNMKSIMHMIQVIKCARPSLKVIEASFYFLN